MWLCWCHMPCGSASHTHIHASNSHANTLKCFLTLFLPPFLPMVMLKPSMLKVALRPFLNRCFLELASIVLQPSSNPGVFIQFRTPPVSCSVLFQLRLVNSPRGEEKKCSPPTPVSAKHWKRTVKHSPLLVTDRAGESLSPPPCLCCTYLFSPSLSFSHLNKLISRRLCLLFCFFFPFQSPSTLPSPLSLSLPLSLSPSLSSPRGTAECRWWVAVVVGRRGDL